MQEMLPGFLAALSLSASLLLVPTLLTQVGAPFMGIYTASMLMAIAGTLAFGRLGLPVAAAPGAALTSWLVAIVMLAHGVSWQMVLFMGAVVSLVMTAALAFTAFSKRPGRLAGLVQLFPPCIADGLQGAVGLMLLVQGLYQGHLLMGSPTGPVQLGNMADPVAYISLVASSRCSPSWLSERAGLCSAAFSRALSSPSPVASGSCRTRLFFCRRVLTAPVFSSYS